MSRDDNNDDFDFEKYENDINYYLENITITYSDIEEQLLKNKINKNDVEKIVEKIKSERIRAQKIAKKFISKVSNVDNDPEYIIKKANKYAAKNNLSETIKNYIIKYTANFKANSDTITPYFYNEDENEEDSMKIANFFGIKKLAGDILDIDKTDINIVHIIKKYYEASKNKYDIIVSQSEHYNLFRSQLFNRKKIKTRDYNIYNHIHPVIAAMFCNKIKYFEDRIIYTNIGEIILERTQSILKMSNFNRNYYDRELDNKFLMDIINDTDSMKLFGNDQSYILNMMNRFKIQIKLWDNIINLRNGNIYGNNDIEKDDILLLENELSNIKLPLYDINMNNSRENEVLFLEKILNIFSIKPTLLNTAYSNIKNGMQVNKIDRSLVSSIRIPSNGQSVHINDIINPVVNRNSYSPSYKTILYTNSIIIFTLNRRYHNIGKNMSNYRVHYNSLKMDNFYSNIELNNIRVDFNTEITIMEKTYRLRSVVGIERSSLKHMKLQTCCYIVEKSESTGDFGVIRYDPMASVYYSNPSGNSHNNVAMTSLKFYGSDDDTNNFHYIASRTGTIFIYELVEK